MPKFSGKLVDWLKWKEEAIAVFGHNDWLDVATHGTVSTDPQFLAINKTLYWCILQAVHFSEAHNQVQKHEKSAFGKSNGNETWRSHVQ